MDRRSVVLAVAVITVFLGVGLWQGRRSVPAPVEVAQAPARPDGPSAGTTILVHVSGAVRHPGVVRLGGSARVVDAVRAAGGFAPGADPASVNLAAPLRDGDQILIFRTDGPGGGSAEPGSGPVDLNRASAKDLEALPGVGPVLAGRIVSRREEMGRFKAVEDLLDVPGIGEAVLERLRPLVVVR